MHFLKGDFVLSLLPKAVVRYLDIKKASDLLFVKGRERLHDFPPLSEERIIPKCVNAG